ncbi:MAG: HD domain-containing protein [Christensenellaceae bacterium]|jgi:putative hydrolase of HD superfamily|nr:HD domain-containing protein [Christensenellaceae bacterium]
MNKIKNVLEFYNLTNKLKTVIRTGWQQWHINAPRVESVAEHIYGTCMLAVAINSEFDYDIDIKKVVYMLAVHELEETIIGDITPFQDVSPEVKKQKGHEAVTKILKQLAKKSDIQSAIAEFEENKTIEARFAKWVDKLEAGLQCKLYDMDGHINVSDENIEMARRHNLKVRNFARLSDSWLEYCIEKYGFDENFIKIAKEARKQ